MFVRLSAAAMLCLGLTAFPAAAQPPPKASMKAGGFRPGSGVARAETLERFRRLSPDERKAALRRLPPERRENVERRLRQWENLSPEQKQRLEGSYARFQELPPERQQEVRELFRRFNDTFPAERRATAQAAIRRLRNAAPEDRKKVMERFEDRFNDEERKLIEQMAAELPERD